VPWHADSEFEVLLLACEGWIKLFAGATQLVQPHDWMGNRLQYDSFTPLQCMHSAALTHWFMGTAAGIVTERVHGQG
jgi:hypothetical protein